MYWIETSKIRVNKKYCGKLRKQNLESNTEWCRSKPLHSSWFKSLGPKTDYPKCGFRDFSQSLGTHAN